MKLRCGIEEVHGAPLSLADAGGLAEQFGHHPPRFGAPHDGLGMLAVGGEDVVILVQPGRRSDRHRLLAAVKVQEAGDVPFGVLLGARLLELPGQDHLLVQFQKFLIRQNRPQSGFHTILPPQPRLYLYSAECTCTSSPVDFILPPVIRTFFRSPLLIPERVLPVVGMQLYQLLRIHMPE